LNGSANGLAAEAMLRQPTANAMATKIYEERLKHPHQRDALDETAMKVQPIPPMMGLFPLRLEVHG
jgi:hypothetical protein